MRKRYQALIYVLVISIVFFLSFVGFIFVNNNPDKLYGRNIEKLTIDFNIYDEHIDLAYVKNMYGEDVVLKYVYGYPYNEGVITIGENGYLGLASKIDYVWKIRIYTDNLDTNSYMNSDHMYNHVYNSYHHISATKEYVEVEFMDVDDFSDNYYIHFNKETNIKKIEILYEGLTDQYLDFEFVENDNSSSYTIGKYISYKHLGDLYGSYSFYDYLVIPDYYKGKPVTDYSRNIKFDRAFIKLNSFINTIYSNTTNCSYLEFDKNNNVNTVEEDAFIGSYTTTYIPRNVYNFLETPSYGSLFIFEGYEPYDYYYSYSDNVYSYINREDILFDQGILYIVNKFTNEASVMRFVNCSDKVKIKSYVTEKNAPITKINFNYNYSSDSNSIKELIIPGTMIAIPENFGENFYYLETLVLEEGVTSIGDYAFKDNKYLKNITLPKSIVSFGKQCFDITEHYIPEEEDTNLYYEGTIESWCNLSFEYFGDNPLYTFNNLYLRNNSGEFELVTSIDIPSYIIIIGSYQFIGIENIKSIYIHEDVAVISSGAFANILGATIYCECEEKPALWQEGWEGICPVVWGYKEDSAKVADWEFTVE